MTFYNNYRLKFKRMEKSFLLSANKFRIKKKTIKNILYNYLLMINQRCNALTKI